VMSCWQPQRYYLNRPRGFTAGEVPVDAHAIRSRIAVYTEDLIGGGVDVRDPRFVGKIPSPKRYFIRASRLTHVTLASNRPVPGCSA